MRTLRLWIVIGAVGLLASLGVLAYQAVLGEPEAASEPISAVPLELDAAAPTAEEPNPTAVDADPTADSPPPTAAAEATETAAPADAPASTEATIYEITSSASQVRFLLDEDLRGERITVVGVTDQVAGQLAFDPADLSSAQAGVIQVNARTLATDNDFRNRAIANRILFTDEFEFITFEPREIVGLPTAVTDGDAVTFQIVGDLTITGITREVVFDVTATFLSESQISGAATTTVMRADYDLQIPSVSGVANVSEAVRIEIDFVADAVN